MKQTVCFFMLHYRFKSRKQPRCLQPAGDCAITSRRSTRYDPSYFSLGFFLLKTAQLGQRRKIFKLMQTFSKIYRFQHHHLMTIYISILYYNYLNRKKKDKLQLRMMQDPVGIIRFLRNICALVKCRILYGPYYITFLDEILHFFYLHATGSRLHMLRKQ